jgi:membrane protease YdiL (CAAX protease family)
MRFVGLAVPLLVLLAATFVASLIGYVLTIFWQDLPLAKVISKITQALLVLSIFPAMAFLKVNKSDLGFANTKQFFKQLALGIGLGLVTLLPVFAVLFMLNVNVVDQTQPWTFGWLAEKTIVSLLVALLISFLEEPLFRGILLTGLGKQLPILAAVVTSAVYYAALHFIKTTAQIPAADLNFVSVLHLPVLAFANLLNPDIQSPFWALLMVGIFLGLLRTQFKTSLGLCIGCHTAWVWQIKLSKSLFNTDFNGDYAFLVSNYDGTIGLLVTCWLALVISVWLFFKDSSNVDPTVLKGKHL